MTEAEIKKHLEEAEKGPKKLAAVVSGLPDKVLRYKPAPNKWCILEIVGHLADVEIIYGYRTRQMIADKRPVIAPVDQDDWARNLGYLEASPAELIAQYGLNRHHNLRLLRRLKPDDLKKSACILSAISTWTWKIWSRDWPATTPIIFNRLND